MRDEHFGRSVPEHVGSGSNRVVEVAIAQLVEVVDVRLAGRQGFEPRYRGPESGEWVAVRVRPLCLVWVFNFTVSLGSPPFRFVHAQNVSLCLRL